MCDDYRYCKLLFENVLFMLRYLKNYDVNIKVCDCRYCKLLFGNVLFILRYLKNYNQPL